MAVRLDKPRAAAAGITAVSAAAACPSAVRAVHRIDLGGVEHAIPICVEVRKPRRVLPRLEAVLQPHLPNLHKENTLSMRPRIIAEKRSGRTTSRPAVSSPPRAGSQLELPPGTVTAVEAMPRRRTLAPRAHVFVYGLYAPMNVGRFRSLGVHTVLGGEIEPRLVELADQLSTGQSPLQHQAQIGLDKIPFMRPARSLLPDISRYAHLRVGNGATRVVGFVEGSRGCKHLCRHCPVVPVYEGKFRVVPVDVVMADIRQQVAAGAEHISFGDPDFLNGPKHALRLVEALHKAFPDLTYDATIKVEHLIKLRHLLPRLKETGCLFVISAVEAVDDKVLAHLAKGHSSADFDETVRLLREVDIAFAPTFVAFTPWTSAEGYVELLKRLVSLRLFESVPPIQLAIRLLVPSGSYLLEAPGFLDLIKDYDQNLLGYP